MTAAVSPAAANASGMTIHQEPMWACPPAILIAVP
jgi:hypothetical protein